MEAWINSGVPRMTVRKRDAAQRSGASPDDQAMAAIASSRGGPLVDRAADVTAASSCGARGELRSSHNDDGEQYQQRRDCGDHWIRLVPQRTEHLLGERRSLTARDENRDDDLVE